MNAKHFLAILKARTMEFVRDRGTFLWNLLFPVILVLGFAFAIPGSGSTLFKVGYTGALDRTVGFTSVSQIEFIPYDSSDPKKTPEAGLERLKEHQLDLFLDFGAKTYTVNDQSKNSLLLRRLFQDELKTGNAEKVQDFAEKSVSGQAVRYVDFLIPGVIGMNIMFSCLFGVGYVIVRYRKNGVLKRLKATPVSALSFVSAQVISRFLIVLLTSIFVFEATNLILGFPMKGSYLLLVLHTMLSILCLISLGMLFATRLRSEELVNGLINLLTFPMMILSGVFFSREGFPSFLTVISDALPLTHFVEGARDIMLHGAGFVDLLPHTAYLGIATVVFLGLSSWLFKWE